MPLFRNHGSLSTYETVCPRYLECRGFEITQLMRLRTAVLTVKSIYGAGKIRPWSRNRSRGRSRPAGVGTCCLEPDPGPLGHFTPSLDSFPEPEPSQFARLRIPASGHRIPDGERLPPPVVDLDRFSSEDVHQLMGRPLGGIHPVPPHDRKEPTAECAGCNDVNCPAGLCSCLPW